MPVGTPRVHPGPLTPPSRRDPRGAPLVSTPRTGLHALRALTRRELTRRGDARLGWVVASEWNRPAIRGGNVPGRGQSTAVHPCLVLLLPRRQRGPPSSARTAATSLQVRPGETSYVAGRSQSTPPWRFHDTPPISLLYGEFKLWCPRCFLLDQTTPSSISLGILDWVLPPSFAASAASTSCR
jgi:hypothetical protein